MIFAVIFAFMLMIELIPSVMVQGNSVADSIHDTFSINPWITGIIMSIVTGIVVFGGIQRIATFTEKLVPVMVGLYLLFGFIIIVMNIRHVPEVISLVVEKAFKPEAAAGEDSEQH